MSRYPRSVRLSGVGLYCALMLAGGALVVGAAQAAGSEPNSLASAKAAVAQYTGKHGPFPVTAPLKKRLNGKTIAYLDCSTPVCGLFAQLLQPTQKLLGYKLEMIQAGASVTDIQNAASTIIDDKPAGVLIPAMEPDQFAAQLKQMAAMKLPMTSNGIMYPKHWGFGGAVFDQRLSTQAGKLLADWVIAHDGLHANTAFYGVPELDFSAYVESGFRAEMKRLCRTCSSRYVPISVATIGNTAPSTITSDLQAHPTTRVAVFASAETATGLPAALKAAGVKVQTTGFAPNPAILQYIKNGQFTSGLGLDIPVMIWTQLDELARLIDGQHLTALEQQGEVPIQFLYQKDLAGQNAAKGWTAFPNFAQMFAKVWAGK